MNGKIKGKKILITGGTGSLGKELAGKLSVGNQVVIFSRNEERQYEMRQEFLGNENLHFYIGDVRDTDSLSYAMTNCDYAIHAAAMKDLIMCEDQPLQAVLNNIEGSRSFIKAFEKTNVERCVAVSTDKAAAPSNVYGCTKYIMEKLFQEAGMHSRKVICSARFGNMIDSSGSLVMHWKKKPEMEIKLTHEDVSRFFFTRSEAAETVIDCLLRANSGETFIKQMRAARIKDILSVIFKRENFEIMGLFPGEKIHEDLLSETEISNCFFEDGYYIIKPNQKNPNPPTIHNTRNADYFTKNNLRELLYG